MKKALVNWMDVEVLAARMMGVSEDDRDEIEDAFYSKYEMSLEQFEKVIEDLHPMLAFDISPLTETPSVGYATGNEWIIKKEIAQQFFSNLVSWLGGNEIKKGHKGFERVVTANGEPVFKITITKANK